MRSRDESPGVELIFGVEVCLLRDRVDVWSREMRVEVRVDIWSRGVFAER